MKYIWTAKKKIINNLRKEKNMGSLSNVFGSGESYTTQIDNLTTVLTTIASALGAVILIYGVIRFALAFQKLDQQGEHQATLTIVAGTILIAAGVVVGVLNGN